MAELGSGQRSGFGRTPRAASSFRMYANSDCRSGYISPHKHRCVRQSICPRKSAIRRNWGQITGICGTTIPQWPQTDPLSFEGPAAEFPLLKCSCSGLPMAQPNVTCQQHLPDRDSYQNRNVYLSRTYDGEIERRTGPDATRPLRVRETQTPGRTLGRLQHISPRRRDCSGAERR
jgi:hypothetical protein